MAGETPKELFAKLFQKRILSRPPFIPWVSTFAAKLEQISIREMLSDATLLTRSLQNAQKLFGYDGIPVVFDPTLEAEACGCEVKWNDSGELPEVATCPLGEGATVEDLDISEFERHGRISVALDTASRISILKGREIPVLGVVNGPITLAKLLGGDSVIAGLEGDSYETMELLELSQKLNLKLCRAYCERDVDGIVIAENLLGKLNPSLLNEIVAPMFQTIRNIARYYKAYFIILTQDCSEEHVDPIFGMQADGVVISGDIEFEHVREAAIKHDCCFSANIPCSALLGNQTELKDLARDFMSLRGQEGFFISTEWEVPYDTPVTNFHEIMKSIKETVSKK